MCWRGNACTEPSWFRHRRIRPRPTVFPRSGRIAAQCQEDTHRNRSNSQMGFCRAHTPHTPCSGRGRRTCRCCTEYTPSDHRPTRNAPRRSPCMAWWDPRPRRRFQAHTLYSSAHPGRHTCPPGRPGLRRTPLPPKTVRARSLRTQWPRHCRGQTARLRSCRIASIWPVQTCRRGSLRRESMGRAPSRPATAITCVSTSIDDEAGV